MQTLSVPPTDADHVRGRLDAPVVIVEYGDYDCPHTRRAHGFLLELLAREPQRLALVFRHFPLRHLHQNAQKLAELMQAIRDPEQYWAAHDRLMAQRRMSLEVAEQELTQLGHSIAELSSRSAEAALVVQANVDRGLADGVHSTPSFFFNGAPHDGHYDIDTLRSRIAEAPERAV
ncbi:MAG TPA: thioredoxin domain-containing protein [Polyangiaceae bacterium]|nr:thioredoxin domain-containing protein [Polyangiaceae bacterium]